jgi:hypothetical protein
MAHHETREIATYLRDGSLWVGHVVTGDLELDFGDDRFDAAYGLASFVRARPTSPSKEARSQIQTGSRPAAPIAGGQTEGAAKLDPAVARLKRAA